MRPACLQVLVEYDGVEWYRREWISVYKDSIFHLFLVEHSLVWTDRVDPLSPSGGSDILWPALVSTDAFSPTFVFTPNTDNGEMCLRKYIYFVKCIPFVDRVISLWK